MKLIKKSQLISLIILMIGLAFFTSQVDAQDLFYEEQSMPTHGAYAWESFTIGSDTFLAVANNYNGSTYNIDSEIYKWNGDKNEFEPFQTIPTHGALDWESFTIGSDTFLAVANQCNDSTYNINSEIYKWNKDIKEFEPFQSIPTQRAHDWESFTIGSDTFLAVANQYNGSTHNIDSEIYKWNKDINEFEEEPFQSIPTHGAIDWESFTIGSDTFLAVANLHNGSTHNIDSKIYKWNGSAFVEFQSISTQGAYDWKSFTIGSDTFLAVANFHNDSSYNTNSTVYKWNGNAFVEFQSIPTQGASDWESFTIGSDTFLAVANISNDSTRNIDSKIYIWNGSAFVEFQSIPTHGASDWESFTIGSDTFLAVTNSHNDATYNIDSKIYKWSGSNFEEFQSISTQGARDWESFTIGSDTFLAVANYYNDVTRNIDSEIYKWNGEKNEFEPFQSIPTRGAWDWEGFTIGSDTFLAVANYYNGSTYNIDSEIYKWNEDENEFEPFQSIPTQGAADWESFTIGSDTFLAVANYYNDSTHNINSEIYKWNGSAFVEVQSIPTQGATDWEYFTIGSVTFLALANSHDDTTRNVDSEIYKWNGDENKFELFQQSILTHGAAIWESFTVGSDTFLAVANYYNDSTHNINSEIYKWDGDENKFELFQPISTYGACDWESFTIGCDIFLAVANFSNDSTRNIDSKIYIWNGSEFVEFQSIPTHGAYDWESFTIGYDTFLAVANYGNDSTRNIDSKIYKNIVVKNMILDAGWHMISLPVAPLSPVLSDVFPDAVVVYGYECGVGYVRVKPHEELKVGEGYWILLNEPRIYTLIGAFIDEYTLPVENCWYMIGGCTDPAQVTPHGCDVVVIYEYVLGAGYQRVTGCFEPGKGYWILLNNATDEATISVTVDCQCIH